MGRLARRAWTSLSRRQPSSPVGGGSRCCLLRRLAIVPALAALVGLYGLIADPAGVIANLGEIRPLLPPDAYDLIENELKALVALPQQRLGVAFVVAILPALWSARAGVSTLVEGLNIVYREIDTRNIILEFLASLALTVLILIIACAALLAAVALPALLQFLDVGPLGTHLAALGPLMILGFAVVFVIGALYRYGPHREHGTEALGNGRRCRGDGGLGDGVVSSFLLHF